LFQPKESKTLEGAYTRLVYLVPPNRSPLEVLRNYQEQVQSQGGEILFECKEAECGGAADRSSGGGGGLMSLGMVLLPYARVRDAHFSNGWCATTENIKGQRYTAATMNDGAMHVAVHAYEVVDNMSCKAFNGRTIAAVYVLEQKAREQKLVVVEAKEMADKIMATGSVALYGIYFDTDKSALKAESAPTIKQIVQLLRDDASMKLLVVGHTDNQGEFDYNMNLSQHRADAVVAELTGAHGIQSSRLRPVGIAYASPVAPNTSEEGRARNRRVELVADPR
jgi:outer membrane protein OmpA-like peptidoglycan-associated protein